MLVEVHRSEVLSVLGAADKAVALPRLGGMARADGVVIASERFWAFARRDGSVREGRMPSPPWFCRRLPVVRGLVRLGLALVPLFRGRGVARRHERGLLAAALLGPFALYVLPSSARLPLTAVIAGAL